MTYRWHFNKIRPSDKTREPIQGEFFSTEAISRPGEALVREGIQNSLDAHREGEKVTVRIRVSGNHGAISREKTDPFFYGLEEHIRAPGNGLRDIPQDSEKCSFLAFEDFGTTGLVGDPAAWRPEPGVKNRFYHFFRAEGLSDKGEKDMGRWGVGKQVFPRASRINSIFGLTVRNDDKRKLLMGMAVLKSHDSNGNRYTPDGWYGQRNQEDSPVLPIEEVKLIDLFSEMFDLQRGADPGFSIVVPWYDLELTDIDLVQAVLTGFFWPILREKLEVFVETDSIKTILDVSSLKDEIGKIGGQLEKEILPLIELAKWSKNLTEDKFVLLKSPSKLHAWKWSKDLFQEEALDILRKRFEQGDKIAIRVPVSVREKSREARETFFNIFIRRDGSEQSGRPVFIREGIIIPDIRSPRTRGVRSLVIAEDGPIAAFLGDSENPAHTQWQKDGGNFMGKYASGASDLQFVIRSVHEVVNIICEQERKIDRTLLSDLFSITAPSDQSEIETTGKKKSEKKGTEPDVPTTPPEPRPRAFFIDRIDRGFVIRNGEAFALQKFLLIKVAYHVRRGNPFKKYHTADFDLRKRMTVKWEGLDVLDMKENKIKMKVDSRDFRFEVSGFDKKRDLRIDVRMLEGDDGGSYA